MSQKAGSLDCTEHRETVDASLLHYGKKSAELNEARTALLKINDRLQALERNALAAQTEADMAKTAWTTLLRDGDGALTKEIQKHRAAERSAYTLLEEYKAIRQELKRLFGRQEVLVASLAGEYEDAYRRVVQAKADLALDRAMEVIGLEFGVARQLHDHAACGYNETGQSVPLPVEVLRERFMTHVDRMLAARSAEVSELVAAELEGIILDMTAVDKHLMRSPVARRQRLLQVSASA